MACGIVPAISEAPRPPSRAAAAGRPAPGPRRDDVGPRAHAEDLPTLADALAVPAFPFPEVGARRLGVHVSGDGARRGGQLLPQPPKLEDLVAHGGRTLELEVAGRLLHLGLEPADHGRQLLRLGALDLQRRP